MTSREVASSAVTFSRMAKARRMSKSHIDRYRPELRSLRDLIGPNPASRVQRGSGRLKPDVNLRQSTRVWDPRVSREGEGAGRHERRACGLWVHLLGLIAARLLATRHPQPHFGTAVNFRANLNADPIKRSTDLPSTVDRDGAVIVGHLDELHDRVRHAQLLGELSSWNSEQGAGLTHLPAGSSTARSMPYRISTRCSPIA